ncbi:MAG: hypothetical protein O2971_01095 [Proteobacteria bacterium]|nr:hypothetical protein [Pseudomonadota bacterium]
MGDRFGRWATRTAAIAVGLLLGMTSATAQLADYQAPLTADGSPDLNGIWQSINTANWNIEPHAAGPSMVRELGAIAAVPAGLGVVDGGEIPYRPEARAQRDENFAKRLELDPEIKCYLPGVPRATYLPFPFQIIQSRQHIMLIHEYAGAVRTIYMENHTPAPAPTWMGWSNGSWDGATLVVDTSGFNGQTWFDRAGNFHSDALQVIERFTPRSADTMMYEVTIEDPNVFTRPWTMSMPLYRRVEPNAEILEFRCVEFVEDLIYGHLRKQPERSSQ